MTLDLKKELLKILLGFCYIVALLYAINALELKKWPLIMLLCFTTVSFQIFSNRDPTNFPLKPVFITWIYIIAIVHVILYLDEYGWVGFIVGALIIVFLILYKRRKKYIEVKHHIETMIWGKPLYKFKEEGKKPPKIEIVR